MLKKLIALASLTALTGLGTAVMVAGCTTETTEDDGGDSGATDGSTTKRDGSTTGDGGDTETNICPSPAPTEDPPYKSAAARQEVCDPGIGDFIDNYIKANSSATFKDLEAAIAADSTQGGQACASCVFTIENDAAWGPIVYAGDGSSGGAFFNYGSCFEKAPGGSAACGKAVQSAEFCLDQVCSDEDCGSENAKTACIQTSLGDTSTGCGRFDVQGDCGSGLTALNNSCKTGLDVIKIMCAKPGSGANDGG